MHVRLGVREDFQERLDDLMNKRDAERAERAKRAKESAPVFDALARAVQAWGEEMAEQDRAERVARAERTRARERGAAPVSSRTRAKTAKAKTATTQFLKD